jgi:Bacterial regulatory proteins, luxR family
MLSPQARILAAADVYRALIEPRPHRDARSAGDAAAELRADARAGRLDGDAVEAVLRAAGHVTTRRPERPAGLTSREVEILRLLARGLANKQIARRLEITTKTGLACANAALGENWTCCSLSWVWTFELVKLCPHTNSPPAITSTTTKTIPPKLARRSNTLHASGGSLSSYGSTVSRQQ